MNVPQNDGILSDTILITSILEENQLLHKRIRLQKENKKYREEAFKRLKLEEKKLLEDNQRYTIRFDKYQKKLMEMKQHRGQIEYFLQHHQLFKQLLHNFNVQANNSPIKYYNNQNNIDPDHMTYEQLLELEEKIGKVSKGLTVQEIQILNRRQYQKYESGDLCSICYSELKQKQAVIQLNCGHIYHDECCIGWLKQEKVCPICKQYVI